jgi:hypothetical protein
MGFRRYSKARTTHYNALNYDIYKSKKVPHTPRTNLLLNDNTIDYIYL